MNIYGYPADVLSPREFGGSSQEHNPAIITDNIETMVDGLRRKTDNVSYIIRRIKLYHYNLTIAI